MSVQSFSMIPEVATRLGSWGREGEVFMGEGIARDHVHVSIVFRSMMKHAEQRFNPYYIVEAASLKK